MSSYIISLRLSIWRNPIFGCGWLFVLFCVILASFVLFHVFKENKIVLQEIFVISFCFVKGLFCFVLFCSQKFCFAIFFAKILFLISCLCFTLAGL